MLREDVAEWFDLDRDTRPCSSSPTSQGRRMILGSLAKKASRALWEARDFSSLIRGANRERFAGIIDFSYQHYALGDVLTSQMNMACLAAERGCSAVDLHVIVNPWAPSALAQGFIDRKSVV